MTGNPRKDRTPERDLAALLDALAAELLSAPDEEVRALLREAGAKGRGAAAAVRDLASLALAESEAAPIPNFVAPGASDRLTRNH
ncbi:MAG: hypothetical protein ABSG83_10310 [Roseiarcus sp.]|jgi:hypothetical protein